MKIKNKMHYYTNQLSKFELLKILKSFKHGLNKRRFQNRCYCACCRYGRISSSPKIRRTSLSEKGVKKKYFFGFFDLLKN